MPTQEVASRITIAGALVAVLCCGSAAAQQREPGATSLKVEAHRSAVSGYPVIATRDDSLERRLRFQAAVARDPSQYVWIACEEAGRSIRIVHGEDFAALHARSMTNVSRIGWSSLLSTTGVAAGAHCGGFLIRAGEGYLNKLAFPVVSVTRAGTTVVPLTALSHASCTLQPDGGESVEQCPDLNARIVSARFDADTGLTHVVMTGSFVARVSGEQGTQYSLYQQ